MTGSFRRGRLTVVEARANLRAMTLSRCGAALVVASLVAPQVARADEMKPITIVAPGERSTTTKLVLGGLAGGGVLLGAVGVYFHRDARDAGDQVAADSFTGRAWTPAKQDFVDQADRSRALAITGYAAGGALLIGAIIYWIATEPADETIVIRPGGAQPSVTPTQGGAVLGGTWRF